MGLSRGWGRDSVNSQKGVHRHPLIPGTDWKTDRRMYANANYYRIFETPTNDDGNPLPAHPSRSDNISNGLKTVVQHAAKKCWLDAVLKDVFKEDASMMLDLAIYMISGYYSRLFKAEGCKASHTYGFFAQKPLD